MPGSQHQMGLVGIVKHKKFLKLVNMKSITIEQLAFYLPYELSVMRRYNNTDSDEYFKEKLTGLTTNKVILEGEQEDYINIMPILRPMSDISKPIDTKEGQVNYSIKCDLEKDIDGDWCDRLYADQCESPSTLSPISSFNWWLFENHFDVFGLIDKGLAVNINDTL